MNWKQRYKLASGICKPGEHHFDEYGQCVDCKAYDYDMGEGGEHEHVFDVHPDYRECVVCGGREYEEHPLVKPPSPQLPEHYGFD